MQSKLNAPKIAGITAFCLGGVKLAAGLISGSVAVISSAIDSIMDCMISFFNFLAIKKSDSEATKQFNYGFGKLEALMASCDGLFIAGIGCFIFFSSIKKIASNDHSIDFGIAFWVMLFSTIVTFFLVLFLPKQFKLANSLVIKADILHYKTDLFTNIGIIITLILIKITNLVIIDCIVGILISIYIIFSAIKLIKDGIYVLLDGALDNEIVNDIKNKIAKTPEISDFHNFRTRKSGDTCFFSAHLVFNSDISLKKAHDIGDEIENFLKEKYNFYTWQIDLHFDPTDDSK